MDELKVKIAEIDQRSKSNTHRIDELAEKLDDYGEMVSTIKVLANEQGHIKDDVASIKNTVDSMAEKPGKRWETLLDTVVKIVVGALIAYVFTQIGIG